MPLIEYFAEHHDHLLYMIGGLSFVVELTVLGMGGPLLFFAIASFIVGFLISIGVINQWEMEVLALGVFTAIITFALWKPLKQFQNTGGGPDTSSDMIGLKVPVSSEITKTQGEVRYSGINWMARLSPECDATSVGTDSMVEICGVEGTVMIVTPI